MTSTVPTEPGDRTAPTAVPIHPLLARRWSPRAFDNDAVVSDGDLVALLEAGRWAASWGARQAVRYVVGRRGDATFAALAATLKQGNSWSHDAGALILVCADEGDDDNVGRYAHVDAGAAMANLATEAVARGLVSHPMAGFDADAARTAFAVPEQLRPLFVIAVGELGDYADADPAVVERDTKPRRRLPMSETVFAGTWGSPLHG